MSTLTHDGAETPTRPAAWWTVRDVWASLAITAMWIAVIVTAIAGPNIVTHDVSGTDNSVPAAVAVALFATIGSWGVARYAFRRRDDV